MQRDHHRIRNRLERDAWQRYPQLAGRLSRHRAPPTRRLCWQDRALLILAAFLILLLIVRVETARADPSIQSSAQPEPAAWGLEVTSAGGPRRSLALNTDIAVEITGLAARVVVSQRFRNDGMHWKEAIYRYPLPPGAAVDRLLVEAGDRSLEGEIREKAEARRRYGEARRAGHLASLVEQQRPNQFETRLANIGPGEEVRVEIAFLARVDFSDGRFGLSLPMTFTPRFDAPADTPDPERIATAAGSPHPVLTAAGNDRRLSLEVLLHSSLGLASLESRYHDVDIEPVAGGYRVRLIDPETVTDRLFELNWTPDYGPEPASSLLTWDGGDAVYALLMLAPPLREAIAPRPREVVFVIDTSGSMEGDSLRQAQAALRQGLEFLGPDDHFNLVRFASEADLLFEASVPVYPPYLEEARDFIGSFDANGGTNMAPALGLAMGLPHQDGLLRQIVFITDGSVGNEGQLLLHVAERLNESRLFTVSIGSAPNRWFMRKAAEIGRGSHTQIGREDEVEARMASLWTRIENPAVEDLCVDWGSEAEFYPELIPDLYAGEPLWLHARLPLEPGRVTVCGVLDGRYWESATRLSVGAGGPELAGLWARSKIEALEDSRIFGVDPESIRRDVLDLALRFGLLTPYTSLVATDRSPSRPAGEAISGEDVPGLLPAGSARVSGFAQTATGWPARVALSLLSLFLATAMLLCSAPSRSVRHADGRRNGGPRRPGFPAAPERTAP